MIRAPEVFLFRGVPLRRVEIISPGAGRGEGKSGEKDQKGRWINRPNRPAARITQASGILRKVNAAKAPAASRRVGRSVRVWRPSQNTIPATAPRAAELTPPTKASSPGWGDW